MGHLAQRWTRHGRRRRRAVAVHGRRPARGKVTRALFAAALRDALRGLLRRSLFSLIRYRPDALAGRLTMPLLMCVADGDTAASVPLAIRAARQAPRGELRRYPGGQLAAYLGDVFEQMVGDQTDFLRRQLTPTKVAAPR